MQEQLQAAVRQNAALKERLGQAETHREEFKELAMDREKKLQAALVHLGAAQVWQGTIIGVCVQRAH